MTDSHHDTCIACHGLKSVPRWKYFPWFFHKMCSYCGGSGEIYVEPPPKERRPYRHVRHIEPAPIEEPMLRREEPRMQEVFVPDLRTDYTPIIVAEAAALAPLLSAAGTHGEECN